MTERLRIATRGPVVRRALKYAVGVGAVLIAINQGNLILAGELATADFIKMALTVVVPYCVSTASSVSAELAFTATASAPPAH